jgi:hypothetical protein
LDPELVGASLLERMHFVNRMIHELLQWFDWQRRTTVLHPLPVR